MKSKTKGHYEDTPANRSFLSNLANKLADVIKRPKDFQAMRPRSAKSKKALSGQRSVGGTKYVDLGHYDRARVRGGSLVREKFEVTSGGVLITQAIQILNPGPNLLRRLRDLSKTAEGKTYRWPKQNIFGQIRGTPFLLQKFGEGEGSNLLRAAINYLTDWRPNAYENVLRRQPNAHRKAERAKEDLMESMSVIVQKKRTGPGYDFDDEESEDEDESEE